MTARTEDRRGDRRVAEEWACPNDDCGVGPRFRMESGNGRVLCRACHQTDRRSTDGNRRRAELELQALERRIVRDMEAGTAALKTVSDQLESVAEAIEGVDTLARSRDETVQHDLGQLERKIEDVRDEVDRVRENRTRGLG